MKKTNLTERTIRIVNSKGLGIPFGIEQLYENPCEANNVSVTLNTLQKNGRVIKLGRLGPIPVSEEDIIEFVTKKYNGYISGPYAHCP